MSATAPFGLPITRSPPSHPITVQEAGCGARGKLCRKQGAVHGLGAAGCATTIRLPLCNRVSRIQELGFMNHEEATAAIQLPTPHRVW